MARGRAADRQMTTERRRMSSSSEIYSNVSRTS